MRCPSCRHFITPKPQATKVRCPQCQTVSPVGTTDTGLSEKEAPIPYEREEATVRVNPEKVRRRRSAGYEPMPFPHATHIIIAIVTCGGWLYVYAFLYLMHQLSETHRLMVKLCDLMNEMTD